MKKYVFLPLLAGAVVPSVHAQQPNIVLILCDDMGFSDLGCYGSEIKTPNIDKLAQDGVRFGHFKNTGRSCPSRAALLTGRYQHSVGMGWMTAVDEHRPGYRGQIDAEFPTIAEVLKAGGYSTYMSGKWHVTVDGAFDAPNGSYPMQRGFDRYYGCLSGGGSYYKPTPVYDNLTRVTEFPDDYYYTKAITQRAIDFVNGHDGKTPMFLYVAHYAPHLPLQAPKEYVDKCLDRYREGYDVLRRRRFEKQKQLGIVADTMSLPVYDREFKGHHPAWEELTPQQQEKWTKDMATYAAMVEIMDEGIGQLVEAIDKKGMLDNTVFLFMSDNGATSEGGFINQLRADLSNTPYRSYKQWCLQGGTSSPFIVTFGDKAKNRLKGQICDQTAHIIDVLPTCMDLAGMDYPAAFRHADLPGESLMPAIEGGELQPRTLYFEHQGSCAVIDGDWKLVRYDRDEAWQLIDLSTDPFEANDLSQKYSEKVEELEAKWVAWGNANKVFPLEDKPWQKRIDFYLQKNPDQSGVER